MALKDLIISIAKALVDHPEQVEVLEVAGEQILVKGAGVGPR